MSDKEDGTATGIFDQRYGGAADYDEDLHVQCPSHTTERKLMTKIDLRVMPFLCVMYLLAFLDRVSNTDAYTLYPNTNIL